MINRPEQWKFAIKKLLTVWLEPASTKTDALESYHWTTSTQIIAISRLLSYVVSLFFGKIQTYHQPGVGVRLISEKYAKKYRY